MFDDICKYSLCGWSIITCDWSLPKGSFLVAEQFPMPDYTPLATCLSWRRKSIMRVCMYVMSGYDNFQQGLYWVNDITSCSCVCYRLIKWRKKSSVITVICYYERLPWRNCISDEECFLFCSNDVLAFRWTWQPKRERIGNKGSHI